MNGSLDHRRSTLAITALLLALSSMALAEIRGRTLVIDGDTLEVDGTQVRLDGIDAPELGQPCSTRGNVLAKDSDTYPCGEQAAAALRERIGSDPVFCDEPAPSSPPPMVTVCWLNDEDLGAWMVRSGWARAYPRDVSPYAPAEDLAQAALNGIWRGDFLDPWDWRQEQAARTSEEGRTLAVKVGAANARSAPSREGRLLATLRRGENVERLGKTGQWYHVRLPGGIVGWMFEELLEPITARLETDR
jgi:endonuclease YncB( thermonuclease family)